MYLINNSIGVRVGLLLCSGLGLALMVGADDGYLEGPLLGDVFGR